MDCQQLFKAIFENSPIGIQIVDTDGNFIAANKSYLKLTGVSSNDELKKINIFVHFEHGREWKAKLSKLETVHAEQIIDFDHLKKDLLINSSKSGFAYFDLLISPIMDENKSATHFIVHINNISERKNCEIELLKAKEKAEHSDMTKSQFLANMSHEIRTPMNAVIGFSNLLLKTKLSEEQSEYLKIIESSSNNLLAIINDILDISKIQAGKFKLSHNEFLINDIIDNTVKKLKILADNKGLAISVAAAPVSSKLIGDPVRLEQVLTNLLSNAIKFTKSGKITVNLSVASETEFSCCVNIAVEDTGIGIAEENLEKIFEYFEQLDTRDKKNYAGSGLGLGISKKIVEMMGGRIKVTSRPGCGSVFQFTINFQKAAGRKEHAIAHNALSSSPGHLPADENHIKILIAEDEFVNQRLIASLLELRGWKYQIAASGLETLRMLGSETFDIVLMDIQMPEMDGYEAARAIREMEKITGKKLYIIAVTAFAMRSDYEKCMEAGMDDYISKPLQIDSFFDKIDTILARRGTSLSKAV